MFNPFLVLSMLNFGNAVSGVRQKLTILHFSFFFVLIFRFIMVELDKNFLQIFVLEVAKSVV